MWKTVRAILLFTLTAAVLLPACSAQRAEPTAAEQGRVFTLEAQTDAETSGSDGVSTTEADTETAVRIEADLALPQEPPQTTEAETTAETTVQASTAAKTTADATMTTTTVTATAETNSVTTAVTTKPADAATTKAAETTTTTTTKPASTTSTSKKAETTAAQTTTAKSAKTQAPAGSTAQAILNRAVLHPQKTGDASLDAAVQAVFDRIFTSGMTTYDKVLACYNYIINNSEYARTPMTVTQNDLKAYQSEQESWNVLFAKRILNTGKGVCDDYASLFLVMTRAVGLECYYTHGFTTNTKGETKDHVWDTITVDGVDYIFDAQVEDKQSANGIQYTFFCKPYDSSIAKIYSGYDLASDKAAYNAFRRNG